MDYSHHLQGSSSGRSYGYACPGPLSYPLSETVLKEFHPDALAQYKVRSDLYWISTELADPDVRMLPPKLKIFSRFSPMLCQKSKITSVERAMDHKPFWIETKMVCRLVFHLILIQDGERILMHREGDKYMWLTRNCIDYTHLYGGSSAAGGLSSLIHSSFRSNVTRLTRPFANPPV